MATLIYTTFYAAVATYLVAALAVLRSARSPERRPGKAPFALALGAGVLFTATLFLRWMYWGRPPMTGVTDLLLWFTVIATVQMAIIVWRHRLFSLMLFYVPPIAGLSVLNAVVAGGALGKAPRGLPSIPLTVHVGAAAIAYASFLLAAATSFAYVAQSRALKRREPAAGQRGQLSLEQLDGTLYTLTGHGYAFFAMTLVTGLAWAFCDHELLHAYWWASPKVLLSVLVFPVYAVLFHMRRAGKLRGPGLARWLLAVFSLVLLSYVTQGLMGVRNYGFWGGIQ